MQAHFARIDVGQHIHNFFVIKRQFLWQSVARLRAYSWRHPTCHLLFQNALSTPRTDFYRSVVISNGERATMP
jgi:hypothetical protein